MNMTINETLWANRQYAVLVSFIHYLAYWRCSHKAYSQKSMHSELWTKTINAYLLCAVTDWCMVFGADSNEIHWKQVVTDKLDQHDFRSSLLTDLSITEAEWESYWSSMTMFRNNFAVHRPAKASLPRVPDMKSAFHAVISYDEWLRRKNYARFDHVSREPILRDRYKRLMRTSVEPFNRMVQVGPTVDEEYK